ncbi:MAG: hypothetical protein ACM3X7_14645 [Solirubrobacterales bacterium]
MKNVKKLAAIGIGLLMTSSLFTGCSTDGAALATAIGKSQTITSMQFKSDLSIKISAENMSQQEKQVMDTAMPMINSSTFSVLAKTVSNKDNTKAKVQEDINMQLGQMPFNMGIWADVDMSNGKSSINEIVKLPDLLTAQLPNEFKNKSYMVMNMDDLNKVQGAIPVDYNKLMAFSKESQSDLLYFFGKYAEQFNPGSTYVTKLGTDSITVGGQTQQVTIYQVKLTDSSLKSLMRYTVNNLGENPDAINFVRNYFTSVMSVYDSNNKETEIAKAQFNKALIQLTTDLPGAVASMNKALDVLNDVKILGDDGIVIKYAVNADGYIVNESGTAQLVLDIPAITKAAGTKYDSGLTGIYTISLTFNTDITNINEDIVIDMPKLNSTNSFNYTDLIKASIK